MANTNMLVISGNLGSDPEMKFTANGKAVTTVNLAVSLGFGDNKKTMWLRVEAWEKLGEHLNNFQKGNRVTVTGRLDEDAWDDKATGQKRTKTKVVASNIDGFYEAASKPVDTGASDSDDGKVPF